MTLRYAHLSPQYLKGEVEILDKTLPKSCPSDATKSGKAGYCWRILNQAATGIITRANADRLVFSRSTPAIQSATRPKLIAAAVAKCWR
jgi:hypothetical protein